MPSTPVISADSYIDDLEPSGLLAHFIAAPPAGFTAGLSPSGIPSFTAPFDLLTTADPAALSFFQRIPFHAWLRRRLTWPTVFFGATVTEYLPLTAAPSAPGLVQELLAHWRRSSRLLILKDIPLPSPLLSEAANERAEAFSAACTAAGFVLVEGQALAHLPIDFSDADEYLARLSAGRRRDIRRKLRSRAELTVDILPTGHERFGDAAFLDQLYGLYEQVYDQSELHFDKLSAGFFRAVFQDAGLDGRVFLYSAGDQLISFNLCFIHRGMLIDKFVGFRYPEARQHNLYFVSWLENLTFARQQGLRHYVAGWTDPEIKAYLGARFSLTRHAVYVRNPLLRAILRRLTRFFERDHAWFAQHDHAAAPRS